MHKLSPKEAIAYLRSKGCKLSKNWYDLWKEEHNYAFTVSKVMKQDLLVDIRKALDKALSEGQPFSTFKKELMPYLDKHGWGKQGHRLKTIYDTNIRVARSVGKWDQIQSVKRSVPYLMYMLGPSEKHRPEHLKNQGILLPVDDPFWKTHYPPNGFRCRCWVKQVFKKDVDRYGGVSKSPKLKSKSWKHKGTGKTIQVPEGVDPGWDFNPGIDRASMMKKFEQEKSDLFQKAILLSSLKKSAEDDSK